MQREPTARRILVVDDDRQLCRLLTKLLSQEGYGVVAVQDGAAMRRALADQSFGLVLLDLTFASGDDGIALARTLRAQYEMPLIMLSGKGATVDKVVGLELGADDYVTKPFEPRELLARIRAVLRRAASQLSPDAAAEMHDQRQVVTFSGWRLDLDQRTLVSPQDDEIRLTSQEFALLATLARRPGRVLSRDQILELTVNRRWSPCDRSIDMLICKLRRKIGDSSQGSGLIKTVRGVGYMLAPATLPDGSGRTQSALNG
jgi:two-component system OmpR family response regulator